MSNETLNLSACECAFVETTVTKCEMPAKDSQSLGLKDAAELPKDPQLESQCNITPEPVCQIND